MQTTDDIHPAYAAQRAAGHSARDGHVGAGGAAPRHPHAPANELRLVRELAAALLPECEAIAEGMTDRLYFEIAELADELGGPLIEETRSSCRANVGQILRAWDRGEPVDELVTPPEAIEYARSYVRRELPLAVLLRAYRLGQAYFLKRWASAMSARVGHDPELGEAMVASTAWVFAYVDTICNQLVAEYGKAREQWARTPDALRAETARGIISGAIRDDREAGRLLGHELSRRHHVGVVIWESLENSVGETHRIERAAFPVAEALGMGDPLVVMPGRSEVWAWFSGLHAPDADVARALRSLEWPAGVRLAAGRVRVGLDGFRRSHVEAVAATRVAVLTGDAAAAITMYDEVELVSLLSADLERARAFVSDELGGLAAPDPAVARLRETMLVLLEEGMSNSRAAQRLYVHHNTVVYRTARAQELLGHRLIDRRMQVTAALMLAQTLGDAVLGHEGS